jgi:hypothetical protein
MMIIIGLRGSLSGLCSMVSFSDVNWVIPVAPNNAGADPYSLPVHALGFESHPTDHLVGVLMKNRKAKFGRRFR